MTVMPERLPSGRYRATTYNSHATRIRHRDGRILRLRRKPVLNVDHPARLAEQKHLMGVHFIVGDHCIPEAATARRQFLKWFRGMTTGCREGRIGDQAPKSVSGCHSGPGRNDVPMRRFVPGGVWARGVTACDV